MQRIPGTRPVALLLLLAAGACRNAGADAGPTLEQPPTAQLRAEMAQARASVRAARDATSTDPEQASRALAEAEDALAAMEDYYVPLFRAMEAVGEAYEAARTGDATSVAATLSEVEEILLTLAGEQDSHLAEELREPLELLEDARLDIAAQAPELPTVLAELHRRLRVMVVKGDLILGRSGGG